MQTSWGWVLLAGAFAWGALPACDSTANLTTSPAPTGTSDGTTGGTIGSTAGSTTSDTINTPAASNANCPVSNSPAGASRISPTFTLPLAAGYQADPMLVTFDGNYYLYVDDQLAYNRLRMSSSLRGLSSAESQVIYAPPNDGVVDPSVSCAYIIPWQNKWYQYCGDSNGNLVLESAGNNPLGPYSLAGRLDAPPGYTGYAAWPIAVGSSLYMLITINGQGAAYNSIWIAAFSTPTTRTSPWSMIAHPTSGAGSWECANGRCIDEGGSAVVHGNKVFLAFSAGGYENVDYCVGLLTANVGADLTQANAWTKSPNCVVASSGGAGGWGPGSLIFFKSPDGHEDWVVYHLKASTVNALNGDDRYLLAAPLSWDANGDPVFALPYAQSSLHLLPSGDSGLTLSAPALTSTSSGTVRLFALGSADYDLWQTDIVGNSNAATWLRSDDPPPLNASLGPVATSRGSNSDTVFVTASGDVYARDRGASEATGWLALPRTNPTNCSGGTCAAPNAGGRMGVATWGTSRMMLYTVGMDHGIWELIWNESGGWTTWENNPGQPSVKALGSVAALARIVNYIDLFVRGADGNLYTAYYNNAWSGWSNFGAVPSGNASSPALASKSSTDLQVFERGQDGRIYTQAWNGSTWSGTWTSLGGPPGGAVSDPAAYAASGVTTVATRGSDGLVYLNRNNGTWQGWVSVGAP